MHASLMELNTTRPDSSYLTTTTPTVSGQPSSSLCSYLFCPTHTPSGLSSFPPMPFYLSYPTSTLSVKLSSLPMPLYLLLLSPALKPHHLVLLLRLLCLSTNCPLASELSRQTSSHLMPVNLPSPTPTPSGLPSSPLIPTYLPSLTLTPSGPPSSPFKPSYLPSPSIAPPDRPSSPLMPSSLPF
ncbi:uncharacterized protein [Palaemon carinicauda]|uniref:uncharacterized protein n=1 Tax=Palaemon carinicauda TaxID=392227 RepID=UPI0035B63182